MTEQLRAKMMGVKLTKKEKLISEFVLDNFAEVCFITSTEIAKRLQVSDSSVIRLRVRWGIQGSWISKRISAGCIRKELIVYPIILQFLLKG